MRGGILTVTLFLCVTILLLPGAAADTVGTPADDCRGTVAVCVWRTAVGEEVAVSLEGEAYAEDGLAAVSGSKDTGPQGASDYPVVAVSGAGSSKGSVAVAGVGPAEGGFVAVSGFGDTAASTAAVSGFGTAQSSGVSASGMGDAHARTVAVSGNGDAECTATPCVALDVEPHRTSQALLP